MGTLMLFMVITTSNGYEAMYQVSGVEHKSAISCHIEKSHYTGSTQVSYFCGDPTMYFNKENKLH